LNSEVIFIVVVLLLNSQCRYRVNLESRSVFVDRASIRMVFGRMINVVKGFPRHRDDMRMHDFKNLVRFDRERKLGVCPTEYLLAKLAPSRPNRDFDANASLLPSGVLQGDVNVAVSLNSHVNNAACQRIPSLLGS
jgi:hypothetical protein